MPRTEPTPVKCLKSFTHDNGHEFQAGETYDAFAIHVQNGINYRVGKNRVRLSSLPAEQFNEHFEGMNIGKTDTQKLFD